MILHSARFEIFYFTAVRFGMNIVEAELAGAIREQQKNRVFLVTDPGVAAAGISGRVAASLEAGGIHPVVFDRVEADPRSTTVMEAASLYREEGCDMILAVGGGSAMDLAKGVSVAATHPGDVLDYRLGEKTADQELPLLFAVPTTAGTGSEITAGAVITDAERGRKFVVRAPLLAPAAAYIDPALTLTLPRYQVALTGGDALVHAIESYTSARANPFSDGVALEAIRMIAAHLPLSYAHPGNVESRAQVLLASTLAGIANRQAGLGLVHSCSHPMSARFGVPHGLANCVILPAVVEYNLIAREQKYAAVARCFEPDLVLESDRAAAGQLPGLLQDFLGSLDIPAGFGPLNLTVTPQDLQQLTDDALDDRATIPSNPRQVEREDIYRIYAKLL